MQVINKMNLFIPTKLAQNISLMMLPLFLLIIAITTTIWFFLETKRKNLNLKDRIVWVILNFIYLASIFYIFLVNLLRIFEIYWPNVFNYIAIYVFGIEISKEVGGSFEWIFVLIFAFISFNLIKNVRNHINISKMNSKIDQLNQEMAILQGKISNNIDFNNLQKVKENHTSDWDKKKEFKNQVKIIKNEIKSQKKIVNLQDKFKNIQESEKSKK